MTPHQPHRTARFLLIGTACMAVIATGIGAWLFVMDLRMADALGVGLLLGGVLMVLGVVVLLACVIAILILSRRKTATTVHTSWGQAGDIRRQSVDNRPDSVDNNHPSVEKKSF